MDVVFRKVKVTDITEVNDLIYCEPALVTEMIGMNLKQLRRRNHIGKKIGKPTKITKQRPIEN